MSDWKRDHRQGASYILAAVHWIEGHPHITVVGGGHPPVPVYARGFDDAAAKARADEIVRTDFKHTACEPGCTEWIELRPAAP